MDAIKKNPLVRISYEFYKKLWNNFYRKQNVAMLHIGRVGSTVIGDMMNQHSQIFWDGEPFEKLMKSGTNKSVNFTKRIINKSSNKQRTPIHCFATKFMPEQHLWNECINMDLTSYIEVLKEMNYNKFLFIKRKNYLSQIVSVLVGRKKKQWHSENKTDKVTKIKVDVNNYKAGYELNLPLLEYFESIDKQYKLLGELVDEKNMITISYEEDIEKDPFIAYNKICDFIEIDNQEPIISYKKTNPFSLEDMIENFEEVELILMGTKYEWMLVN